MITHVKVDGFKSLTGFRLSFYPGLNILVGPNGSGKTNIVSFFEYLADLMEGDASEATSRVGGAGACSGVWRRHMHLESPSILLDAFNFRNDAVAKPRGHLQKKKIGRTTFIRIR